MGTETRLTSPSLETFVRSLPSPPRSQRHLRYSGDDRGVALSDLASSDREGVRELYALLTGFDAALREDHHQGNESGNVERLAASFDLDRVVAVARSLGASSDLPLAVRHALHDVRGGALTSLIMEVQRTRSGLGEGGTRALKTLSSDHLKVMRSALVELDDASRAADLTPRVHSVGRLAETLRRVKGNGPRGTVEVAVSCSFSGAVTMSCIELGALDRAVLNVVNNAVRHSASAAVDVLLAPAGARPNSDLRVCVVNRLEEVDVAALHIRFGDQLTRMFIEPFTTTGSGQGLKICLDFVASAYGLARAEDAVRAGLVGTTIDRGWFFAWLCWPAVA